MNCPHGMGDPRWCSVCQCMVDAIEHARGVLARVRAQHASRCPRCWAFISAGDTVCLLEGDQEWVCDECAES